MSTARELGGEKSDAGVPQTAENAKPWEKLFLKRNDRPWQHKGEMQYSNIIDSVRRYRFLRKKSFRNV